jgi:hypothetical protein
MAQGLQASQQNPEVVVNSMIFGMATLDVTGGSDYTISDDEFNNAIFRCTGALTADINIIVPGGIYGPKIYHFLNKTTGAYTITVKHATGTGGTVPQGGTAIFLCDEDSTVVYKIV